MGYLDNVSFGPSVTGAKVVITGQEKIGKTTLATGAPRSLLIPLEQGFANVRTAKTEQIQSWEELNMLFYNEIIPSIQNGTFKFQSIVIDSATALERLLHDFIVRTSGKAGDTMETAMGGYGKAYVRATEDFWRFLQMLDQIATLGKRNIILTAHTVLTRIADPAAGEYDTWDLRLHTPKDNRKTGKREALAEWADLIGFLHEPIYVRKDDKGNLSQGISAQQGRVLAVERTPAYLAGNRYGLKGVVTIPEQGGWNSLATAIMNASGLDLHNRD